MGRKKRPIYAVVAADSRSPRDGRFIEDLGRYEPLTEPATTRLNDERVLYWLSQGAQPSDTVRSILSKHGLMLAFHMKRKGAAEEDILAAVETHRLRRAEKDQASVKTTASDRQIAALKEEEKVAAELAEEEARKRAETDARAKADAETARKAAAEERARAAEEARTEQEAANVDQAAADAPAKQEPAEAAAEEAAAEAPAEKEPAEAASKDEDKA